ncbi:MAG: SHOCT domain-containing protein [Candidatus Loosdrechtia sp.]|uniref:SHOCT domain-containing protein n=1 Tax=Candidatus Loosdrechtia sp. TaxID=3101272 RepID=UPI003A799244|nr:MAG: SHOCT domain-containing protein [Candidatus Jettenia sp. AMX2]
MFWFYDPFTWLIFFLVIGLGVYLIVKYELVVMGKKSKDITTDTTDFASGESPLEILEKRFARGEITEHEFERMKKKIEET